MEGQERILEHRRGYILAVVVVAAVDSETDPD
jgi:hypothetical protein